jgi:hypothetical protein
VKSSVAKCGWSPGCMLPDLPHDPAHALIALSDGAGRCPRSGWRYFGRGRVAHDFTGEACGVPAFSRRRAWRFSRLAADFSLRRASLRRCSMFILYSRTLRRRLKAQRFGDAPRGL